MGRARLSLYAVAVLASLAGATAACVLLGELLQRGGHPLGARLVGLLPVPLALAAGVALTRWVRQVGDRLDLGRDRLQHVLAAKRLASLEHHGSDVVLLLAQGGAVLDANERAEEAYGRSRDELRRLDIRELSAPDALGRVEAQLEQTRREGGSRYRTHHRRRDGSTFPVEVSAWTVEVSDARFIQLVIRDLAEKEEMERQLRESEARFRRLAENARDVIFRFRLRPTRGFDYVSPSSAALTGYRPEEFYLDAGIAARISHPRDRRDFLTVAAAGGGTCTVRLTRRDGTVAWTEQTLSLVRGDRGEPLAVEAIVRDVSERKRMEAELQRSQERAQLALAASGVEAVELDLGARLIHVGPRWAGILGLPGPGPVPIGPSFPRVRPGPAHADDWPALQAQLAEVLAGRAESIEATSRVIGPDARTHWLELRGRVAERGSDGAPLRLFGTLRDVTEGKALQARLEVADRLAAVGTLAAGVAHEINNPLAYVAANLVFLGEQVERLASAPAAGGDVAELRQALAEASDGAGRVRDIVQGLRRFGRPGPADRRPVNVRREIEAAVSLARNEVAHRARLLVDLGDLPPLPAAEHELGQVFVNLLLNAAQAIPEGRAGENEVRVTARSANGEIVAEVSDTGCGIPPENFPRIFDPFFTTKPAGLGTGLGLSITHGIVSGLGGSIEVESASGRGTTFRVRLPVHGQPAQVPAPAGAPPAAAARRARVLVVDDELLVGRAVARVLGGEHEVQAVTSPAEALRRAARGESWDIVLCDLMMPEMDGAEFGARLAEVAPALAGRIVYMTGGAFTDQIREFLEHDRHPHVEKPIDPALLRSLVAARVALSAGATPAE
jgi:PAS domain S-box-containing protein